jgi:hypothetical protein
MSVTSRKPRLIVAGIMAVVLALSGAAAVGAADAAKPAYEISGLNITPGSNGKELNFAWFSTVGATKSVVQIAKASDKTGTAFPAAKAKSFTGTQAKVTATLFNGDDKSVPTGSFSNKVTVTGLADSTGYVYRVGDGKNWGDVNEIATRDQKNFSFFAVGDPQIGAKSTGPKTIDSDTAGWVDTINKATGKYGSASFLLCLGDEVNDYNKLETQNLEYAAYFSPVQFKSLPVATVDGNHDFQLGEYYGFHYNLPNLSSQYGISYGNDGDYWFTYGNALFLMLNSNTESIATHDQFIRDAIAKNPAAKWRIVGFHHSVYSEADHYADPDVIDRRSNFPPVFDRYKIDVVLQGHDHAYTRTFQILKGKPMTDQTIDSDGNVVDPTGTVYLTLNSGSGSKFYDWKDATPEVFSAARWQGKVPSFSYVSLSDNKFSISTFRTDDMSVIDTYSILKTK